MHQKANTLEENPEIIPLLHKIMTKCNRLISSAHEFVSESEAECKLVDNLRNIISDIESRLLIIFFKDTPVTFYDPRGDVKPMRVNIGSIYKKYGADKTIEYIYRFLTSTAVDKKNLLEKINREAERAADLDSWD